MIEIKSFNELPRKAKKKAKKKQIIDLQNDPEFQELMFNCWVDIIFPGVKSESLKPKQWPYPQLK